MENDYTSKSSVLRIWARPRPEGLGVVTRILIKLNRFNLAAADAAPCPWPQRRPVQSIANKAPIDRSLRIHQNPQFASLRYSTQPALVLANFSCLAVRAFASSKQPQGQPRLRRCLPSPPLDIFPCPWLAEGAPVYKIFY